MITECLKDFKSLTTGYSKVALLNIRLFYLWIVLYYFFKTDEVFSFLINKVDETMKHNLDVLGRTKILINPSCPVHFRKLY